MLLVIDIGNTWTVFGVYRGNELINHWRLSTVVNKTVEEYAILVSGLLRLGQILLNQIDTAIISCVVPPLLASFDALCRKYMGVKPIIVGPGIKTGMPILCENPQEIGADRIVNAVAAYDARKSAHIIIDFGTAIAFDYITPKGEYVGGALYPGILVSVEALWERASKLPRVELVKPKEIIGRNTVSAMQAGIIYGYIDLIDGVVKRMKEEVKTNPYVIATGGPAKLFFKESETIDEVDEFLTLRGLKILYERNKNFHKSR
jgi:type III pantothenate kinase